MNKPLIDTLKKRNASYKYDLYADVFQYLDVKRAINNPSISIVIISWRFHPNTLINLRMLEQQRKQNFELIFVNNGGTEDEFQALDPYIDKYIKLNMNTGAYLARNIGAIFAEAPIILFLEDDGIADIDLIESHLMTHQIYDVISVRGVCLPETDVKIHEEYPHYFLGNSFFPHIVTLEGNASYRATTFFEVGGWDDEIRFGHGGVELSIRLTNVESDKGKQIYSPYSIIYHDLMTDPVKLEAKYKRQRESLERLKGKYPNWIEFLNSWRPLYKKEEYLSYKTSSMDELSYFMKKIKQIESRNFIYFFKNTDCTSVSNFDKDRFQEFKTYSTVYEKRICIFGSGEYGKLLLNRLLDEQIEVTCFYDNDINKWGNYINDTVISSPDVISNKDLIIIASSWKQEISLQLDDKGLQKGKDYFIYQLS